MRNIISHAARLRGNRAQVSLAIWRMGRREVGGGEIEQKWRYNLLRGTIPFGCARGSHVVEATSSQCLHSTRLRGDRSALVHCNDGGQFGRVDGDQRERRWSGKGGGMRNEQGSRVWTVADHACDLNVGGAIMRSRTVLYRDFD
nr:hypothetical protein CFP56_00777 [Quercus suber]